LKRENWIRALIFVNTKTGVNWLTSKLKGNRWPAEGITGDLPQRKRFNLMERFKDGSIKILVATDVASRGIHVEDISHVINYDLPQDAENYIHRIGRTARAGKAGRALSIACERYVFHLEPLEEMLGYKIPVVWPENDWFIEDKAGPVFIATRDRKKRSAQRPTHAKKHHARQKVSGKARRSAYPGAFFGFGPPSLNKNRPAPPAHKDQPVGRKKKSRFIKKIGLLKNKF